MFQTVNKYGYRLDLFFDMKISSVFHVSLLIPISRGFHSDHISLTFSAILVDDEKIFKIKKILDFKLV